MKFNREHAITPQTIQKSVQDMIQVRSSAERFSEGIVREPKAGYIPEKSLRIAELETEMMEAAKKLEFEKAAVLRDRIAELKGVKGVIGQKKN